jgi:hypothetical protein
LLLLSLLPFYFSLLFFSLALALLHPSQFILHPFLFFFPLWLYAPRQVRDLAEELPYWVDRHYAILFSSFLLTLG